MIVLGVPPSYKLEFSGVQKTNQKNMFVRQQKFLQPFALLFSYSMTVIIYRIKLALTLRWIG